MIIVQSDLLNDIVVLQFCDLPPFLCNKREEKDRNYKTCPLSSTLENTMNLCLHEQQR